MEDRVIIPHVDSQKLMAIRELGRKHSESGDSIWNGRYHGLDLVFASFKSPRRPSLIEIDLR